MNEVAIKDAILNGNRIDSFTSPSALEQMVRWTVNEALKMRMQPGGDMSNTDTVVKRLTELLLRDYPSLTDMELKIVMEAGISGELGKETWVSGASILQWLRAYTRHASRLAVIDEEMEKKQTKRSKTKEEIDDLNRRSLERSIRCGFEYFKETGSIFGDDPRAFHFPQWAAMVYQHYYFKGIIPIPDENRVKEAENFANRKLIESSTKKEYMPSTREDWMDAYFLERYFEDLVKSGK